MVATFLYLMELEKSKLFKYQNFKILERNMKLPDMDLSTCI